MSHVRRQHPPPHLSTKEVEVASDVGLGGERNVVHHSPPMPTPTPTPTSGVGIGGEGEGPTPILLLGTGEELGSYRALKILAAASLLSVPVTCKVVPAERIASLCTLAKSMVLALPLPDGGVKYTYVGGGANVLLRTVASLAPPSPPSLRCCDEDPGVSAAKVDSWVTFAWTAIEVPLDALRRVGAGAGTTTATTGGLAGHDAAVEVVDTDDVRGGVEADVGGAMVVLDRHLSDGTRVVGRGTTIADLALAAALGEATSLLGGGGPAGGNGGGRGRAGMAGRDEGGRRDGSREGGSVVCWGGGEFANVERWYRAVTGMDCHVSADAERRMIRRSFSGDDVVDGGGWLGV